MESPAAGWLPPLLTPKAQLLRHEPRMSPETGRAGPGLCGRPGEPMGAEDGEKGLQLCPQAQRGGRDMGLCPAENICR